MNDRFKFRVWDKRRNKFIKSPEPTPMLQANGLLAYFNNAEYMNNYVIQFCTGLKDKNGKLIYEGDIINDKSNHIRVVVWEQDCFKYPALKTSRYFHSPISNKLEERKVDLRGKLTFQDNVCKRDKKHFEVIGNIYENKELLG